LLGFLGVGIAQLMRQLRTLVVLVLEPGAPPATRDVSAALERSRRHIEIAALAAACIWSVLLRERSDVRWRGRAVSSLGRARWRPVVFVVEGSVEPFQATASR
jgi:hypothetical protein